jgi:hypothetical protein
MDDLRERLERLAARAEDEANAIERLRQARARGHRRRKVVAGSLALIIAVGGLSFAYGALRTPRGIGPAVPTDTGVAYEPPAIPYLWPENWARDETETPGDVQAEVDAGDEDVQWRTDPSEVASRFAKGVLGWEYVVATEMNDSTDWADSIIFGVSPDCSPDQNCAVFGADQFVRLVQPEARGKGGIWSVAAAWARGLDVTARPKDDPIDAFMPGSTLPMHLNVSSDQTVVVGAVGQNGCSRFVSVDQDVASDYELPLPDALEPGDTGYGCGDLAASYIFAYTVPKLTVPTGDPFLEPAAITAVTAVPYLQAWMPSQSASATRSGSAGVRTT